MTAPAAALTVLITNNTLAHRAGTELYVRDIALALRDRGHRPVAYSQTLGAVAVELRTAGIPVVDDLDRLDEAPDVIHAQHHLESMTALLRWSSAPAVFVCHGARPWEEAPPLFPRIRRYVAIDDACRERLVEHGVPSDAIDVILNFVDLSRFPARVGLPERPSRALIFDNGITTGDASPVRDACAAAGISLDLAGLASGRVVETPGPLLEQFEIVFARGRSALEAMATGAAVILHGEGRVGPLVTAGDFDRLRALNFGYRTFTNTVTPELVSAELRRYNAADATLVSSRVRAEAGRDHVIDWLVEIYRAVIEAHQRSAFDPAADERAAAAYLRWLAPRIKARDLIAADRDRLQMEFDHWQTERAEFVADREWLKTELADVKRQLQEGTAAARPVDSDKQRPRVSWLRRGRGGSG